MSPGTSEQTRSRSCGPTIFAVFPKLMTAVQPGSYHIAAQGIKARANDVHDYRGFGVRCLRPRMSLTFDGDSAVPAAEDSGALAPACGELLRQPCGFLCPRCSGVS